jgi:hypothetical protein
VVARILPVTDQRMDVRTLRAERTLVRLIGVGRNRIEKVAVIALEAKIGARSQIMIAEARQKISAAGEIKACLPPDPVVVAPVPVVVAAVAVVEAVAVEAAADAADNRRGKTTQPLTNGGILKWCHIWIERKENPGSNVAGY